MDAILTAIKTHAIQFIDLRFTDLLGKEHHISIPSHAADADFFQYGKMFDGSSLTGFRHINESDMVLMPDVEHFHVDPFMTPSTLVLRCAVYEPKDFKPYLRDPRSLALRAEAYLRQTGIADTVYFGPEPEFFVFDSVTWRNDMHCTQYEIDSKEAAWTSDKQFAEGNMGHRPLVKGGYFPVPPVDSSQTLRSTMCQTLEKIGIIVEAHHHEVATANQNEISTRFNTLTQKADELQMLKYVVHNTAHALGKTATFMPKPLVGDNGSGMHCHQSLFKKGQNLFAGEAYAGLSQLARYYIGGIIHHARALNAFTNASTNSYRRLVPGFEAPVMLAYSACNRSAAIRIPFTPNPKARRIEVRFPDPAINPYFAFAAMLMAGLDGIERQLDPGPALDKDLYELSEAEAKDIPKVAFSLGEALNALEQDRAFLLKGDVFSDDLIDAYIRVKREEERRVREGVHPLEFALYYSL